MRKKLLRRRVISAAVALVLIVAAVLLTVYFTTREKTSGTLKEEKVVRDTLSSNLSSTGVIKDISTSAKIPLAALTVDDPEKLSDIVENDYTVALPYLLGEAGDTPVIYRVISVNEDYRGKGSKIDTSAENVVLATLAPAYFDWAAAAVYYQLEVDAGTTEAENVREYVLTLLLRDGGSDIDPKKFPDEFFAEDMSALVTVDTDMLSAMVLSEVSYLDSIEYTLKDLVCTEGELLLLDQSLLTVSYSEKFVSFVLSEYDVAGIHARMRKDERVYAAVGINALTGRELIAEIVRIESGANSSGVSYFTLLGRLVFPEIVKNADGTEKSDYTYYDEILTDNMVRYLGVNITDNVREEELLNNYSTTVTAQKTVVTDTLIVPTKCIYYDDSKKPYVVVLDAEKKEKRVYIKITLSTGTDAAVTAADGYTLNEGDVLRYTAEAGLIGSLF